MADAPAISADIKLVLRQAPAFKPSQDGSTLYCAFTNTPSGVPGDLPLGPTGEATQRTAHFTRNVRRDQSEGSNPRS